MLRHTINSTKVKPWLASFVSEGWRRAKKKKPSRYIKHMLGRWDKKCVSGTYKLFTYLVHQTLELVNIFKTPVDASESDVSHLV